MSVLRESRIHDAVGKLRARRAIAWIRQHGTGGADQGRMAWEAGYTNGTTLNSAYYRLDNGDRLGWQYQGGQWRLAVITAGLNGSDEGVRGARHAYVAERDMAWFDFAPVEELSASGQAVSKAEAAGGFNRYDPDFVYRYSKVKNLALQDMTALSTTYLHRAAGWPS